MKLRLAVPALAGLALGLAACGDPEPASPATAQERINLTVPVLWDDAVDAFDAIGQSEVWKSVDLGMQSLDTSLATLPMPLWPRPSTEPDPLVPRDAIDESPGEELARALREKVFTDANYEGDGVYRLHGADFCEHDAVTDAPDPECVNDFDAAEIRVRALLAGDGLDLTLLIGPARSEPITVELRTDRVSLTLDLAETKEAIVHVAAIAGETVEMPAVVDGVAVLSLKRNGPQDVSVELSARRAIRIEGTLPEGRGDYAFGLAAGDPLGSVRVRGPERSLELALDLGPFTVSVPWRELAPESALTGQLAVDWKGLSGSVLLDEAQQLLRLENLGFGDSTSSVKLGAETLFALDLNPAAGRRFDLAVTPVAGANPTLGFTPELDLSLAFHLAPLAEAGEDVPGYLTDETYRLRFTGAGPLAQPLAANETTGFPGGLEILAGELRLESSAVAAPVVVTAGQCLLGDPVSESDHLIFGALKAGPCQ